MVHVASRLKFHTHSLYLYEASFEIWNSLWLYTMSILSQIFDLWALIILCNTVLIDSYYTVAKIAPLTNSLQLTSISPQNSANITFSLTCNSSGGPVQSVEWMRDGFPLDNTGPLILTSASTASYTNTLDVSGRLPGTYTCQIRGSDNQILNSVDTAINGMIVILFSH